MQKVDIGATIEQVAYYDNQGLDKEDAIRRAVEDKL